jgi:sulfur carrier protein ThiS
MKLFNEKEGKERNLEFEGTAEQLFKQLKLNPEEFLVVKNKVLVTLDEKLTDSDEIKLLSVVSGG